MIPENIRKCLLEIVIKSTKLFLKNLVKIVNNDPTLI